MRKLYLRVHNRIVWWQIKRMLRRQGQGHLIEQCRKAIFG